MNEFRESFILYCKTGCFKRQKPDGSLHRIARAFCCFLSSFACPKEETRKRPPSQSWPCGLPLLLAEGGTNGGKSHWYAAEHRRGCRKGDLHCLSAASLQSPGSIEEYPMRGINSGHPAHGGTCAWVPFLWFVSLGKQRNEQMNFVRNAPSNPTPRINQQGC